MIDYLIYSVITLLILSTILLGVLVPGGPIEKRSFSHIAPFILAVFNTFLTILGLGSLILAILVFLKYRWALYAASLCGIAYFLVYAMDLGKIFPVSPDKMPRALFIIEVIGLILSIPLIALAFISAHNLQNSNVGFVISSGIMVLIALLTLSGLGIIIFATKSAMRK